MPTETKQTTTSTPMASPSRLRWFAILTGLTALSVFVQAVIAGQFVSQDHRHSWIDVHSMVANVVAALALITMVFAIVALRRSCKALTILTVVLFVLVVVQVFIGHEITDNKQDWLIGIHVPLAFIIFGIAGWLPIRSAMLRRGAARANAAD